jgi:hypothetical protein
MCPAEGQGVLMSHVRMSDFALALSLSLIEVSPSIRQKAQWLKENSQLIFPTYLPIYRSQAV